MPSPCKLPTKFLIRELTSDITDDSETESEGGSETETPRPGCATPELATPLGRDGTVVAITFLIGSTLVAPESPEPAPLRRSPSIPSALLALVPTVETIGASEVPDIKQH